MHFIFLKLNFTPNKGFEGIFFGSNFVFSAVQNVVFTINKFLKNWSLYIKIETQDCEVKFRLDI